MIYCVQTEIGNSVRNYWYGDETRAFEWYHAHKASADKVSISCGPDDSNMQVLLVWTKNSQEIQLHPAP